MIFGALGELALGQIGYIQPIPVPPSGSTGGGGAQGGFSYPAGNRKHREEVRSAIRTALSKHGTGKRKKRKPVTQEAVQHIAAIALDWVQEIPAPVGIDLAPLLPHLRQLRSQIGRLAERLKAEKQTQAKDAADLKQLQNLFIEYERLEERDEEETVMAMILAIAHFETKER